MEVGLKTMGQSEENRWRSVLLNVLLVNDKSMPGQPCFRRQGSFFYSENHLQTVRKLWKTWSQGLGYGIIKSTKPQWRTQAWGTFKERIGIR